MKSVLFIVIMWWGLSCSLQGQTNPGIQLDVAYVCSSTSFFDLDDLLVTSGADFGGVWTVDNNPNQAPVVPPAPDAMGVIDISSSGNLPAFSYTYTVSNGNSADYIVQVFPQPNIMLDTVCISETQVDLIITISSGAGGPYQVTSTAFTGTQVATNSVPLPAITLPTTPSTSYSISVTDQSGLMCDSTLVFNTPTCLCPSILAGTNETYICTEDSANDLLSFFPTITNPNGNFLVWVTDVTDPVNTQYNGGVLTNMGCSPDTIVYHAMIECALSSTPIIGWLDLNYEYTVYVYPNDVSSFVTSNGAGTCMTSIMIDPSCGTFLSADVPDQIATTGSGMGTHTYNLIYDFGISGLNCITPNPFMIDIIYDCPAQCTNSITPTFNQLGPYCQYDSPGVLPTTSDNGITGTWDNNIITTIEGATTYTFTPNDPSQCGITTTMTINVIDCSCPVSLYVSGTITDNLYEASYNIYSDGNVSTTPVTFHANNYIDLLPNFDVPLNTQFTAEIQPCGVTP